MPAHDTMTSSRQPRSRNATLVQALPGISQTGPSYRVSVADALAHQFLVELDLSHPEPAGQEFWLPVWIPGSYLVREFARHILQLQAWCGDKPIALHKIAKNRWRAAPCNGPLRLRYSVYAFDLSVRTAYLDTQRGFFNASSLLLAAAGREQQPHTVTLACPDFASHWTVATTLPAVQCDANGFGSRRAANYDALIDHPVEMGELLRLEFSAGGAPHAMVIALGNRLHDTVDTRRLARDLKRICSAQIALFEPRSKRAPFAEYLFMVAPTAEGYGGLEHADSTALMCARRSLPHPRLQDTDSAHSAHNDYRDFLGLCSHEYFHAWNVKRIKPQAFTPYDLQAENPTTLLWLFEGFTAYYDDLMVLRAELITPQQYLDGLARTLGAVLRTPGRQVQSVAEASFDAWTKYYRPDENTANATVSYYQLGALVALSIDLRLRRESAATLDDVMRLLWTRYGRADAPLRAEGVAEDALPALLKEVSGLDWRAFFRRHVHGTELPPVKTQFADFGIQWASQEDTPLDALGLAAQEQAGGWLTVQRVRNGGWAERAGLAAGDLLLMLDGERARKAVIERRHAQARAGDVWRLTWLRQDLEQHSETPWFALPDSRVQLRLADKPRPAQRQRLSAWMGTAL
ncbi:putative Peptidase M61, glycyl monoaminopeptidase [Thiomonas sp. CB2]|nr:putative Peptidase M61, glycyl monoaminopeptidase [Thiomonas sp. CB2]VDY05518.1 putative Peptidase M61, glycyl monoaminopeptidase [Thiomonas sp. Bio17B3]VDY07318.1 putative Peptidase M61, glycyl monoaminopeptidase [Thiomonas sp. Sup16B3]VDY13769.1 putative Peptidase M61, glycyl monoaminopeptidase [Thiomonas sp. OC7]VDY17030.1 putative Peptidase M61, glycyl monoaminopeptidase [Thiomonas sp. CB2]